MTINDLIERLEEYRDDLGSDAEVRMMTQQNWPFENSIFGLVSGAEINHEEDGEDEDVESENVCYICEGTQLCYGSKRAWEAAY